MEWLWITVMAATAYLIGSINTAILVGRLMSGDDIRNHGSGNAGMTNTLRTYGKKAAVMVLLGDALKAAVAVVLAMVVSELCGFPDDMSCMMVYAAGFGAVLGHNFPVYFGFRGGKGVLVSAVAVLMVDWRIGLGVVAAALVVMLVSKYVSLGSMTGAVALVACAGIFRTDDTAFIVFSVLLAALLIIMHRTNISRLVHGTENKLGQKKSI